MLFVLSTLGMLYVILFSEPREILDEYHQTLSMLPFIFGIVVGALYLLVSFASGVLPIPGGLAGDLYGLIAGPFGTPWWYYALATGALFFAYSITRYNEVAALRGLRDEVDEARNDLDEAVAHAEDGDVEAAERILDDLEPRLRSMRQTATEHDLSDLRGEISTLHQKRRFQLEELAED